MRYQDFKERFKDFPVISLGDIQKIDPLFYRARLNEWQRKGYLTKLRRGYYLFADRQLDDQALFLIANHLYPPSYVSFEMALAHYNLIPESVYLVTSASSRKTAYFKTPVADFSYRRLKPELMFGYRLEKMGMHVYCIADIEKATLDYLYLHPRIIHQSAFHEWRFNSEEFLTRASLKQFATYARAFRNDVLLANSKKLLTLIHESR